MYHSYQEKLRKQREGISETPAYLGGEASTGPGRKRSQKASWKPHQNMEACTFLLSVQEGQAGRGLRQKGHAVCQPTIRS